MIEEALPEHPGIALSTLCEIFGVSRSWYYERSRLDEKAKNKPDVELRDAIEQRWS
jgi:hypothetical protein